MNQLNKEQILKRIDELGKNQSWNHSIEIMDGLYTTNPIQQSKGKNLIKWGRMRSYLEKIDLTDKRVLDLGSNDGFFSVKLAEMGANVLAVEANKDRIEKERFVFDIKGVSDKVSILEKSVYELDSAKIGEFDLILCMGFLHRVPNMFAVLEIVSKLGHTVILEFKAFTKYAFDKPYLYFDGKRSDPSDIYSTCYFVPSISAVLKMSKSLGFHYFNIIGDGEDRRAMLILSKVAQPNLVDKEFLTFPNRIFMIKKYLRSFFANIRNVFTAQKNV